MTGTAMTESEEFADIYNLSVFEIPTNAPITRKDNDDEIYRTTDEKYNSIISQVVECSKNQQPVLIGTTSIEKSETISKKLKQSKVSHVILNAKHHEQEAEIIANAGAPSAVTIATNMAGRGTDIQLGGNLEFSKSFNKNNENTDQIEKDIKEKKELVIKSGGLYVIGSERHESRRIDNQLRGRSGRQGDPGETKFFLSLEDDLMRIFGSEKMDSVLKTLGLQEGESIKHAWISKALERAQKKVEGRNFDIRKTLLKFDDVLNDQRKIIFEQRLELMSVENIGEIAKDMQYDVADGIVDMYAPEKLYVDQWNIEEIKNEVKMLFAENIELESYLEKEDFNQDQLKNKIYDIINNKSKLRAADHPKEIINNLERMVLLKILDDKWKDHINDLEHLRSTIGLRGYGQRNPLDEYKNEAFGLFEDLISNLKHDVAKIFSRMAIRPNANFEENQNKHLETNSKPSVEINKKIPRNAPCPCGSNRKYKHCHGKIN
jgi:preprotein translocase subunit SecA